MSKTKQEITKNLLKGHTCDNCGNIWGSPCAANKEYPHDKTCLNWVEKLQPSFHKLTAEEIAYGLKLAEDE